MREKDVKFTQHTQQTVIQNTSSSQQEEHPFESHIDEPVYDAYTGRDTAPELNFLQLSQPGTPGQYYDGHEVFAESDHVPGFGKAQGTGYHGQDQDHDHAQSVVAQGLVSFPFLLHLALFDSSFIILCVLSPICLSIFELVLRQIMHHAAHILWNRSSPCLL